MKQYICEICGHVYDPRAGHPETGISVGTSFADIPADWHCPICNANKNHFQVMKSS